MQGLVSPQQERQIITALLLGDILPRDLFDRLGPDDFSADSRVAIVRACKALFGRVSRFDALAVESELEREFGKIPAALREELLECTSQIVINSQIETACQMVRDLAAARRVVNACQRAIIEAGEGVEYPSDFAQRIAQRVTEAANHRSAPDVSVQIGEAVANAFGSLIEAAKGSNALGMSCGFGAIDRLRGGFFPGELVIVAGRPGMGKTAFAMSLLRNMATNGKRSLFFSLEMSSDELSRRYLASAAGVDGRKLRTLSMSRDDMERMGHALGSFQGLPLFVDDTPGRLIADIRAIARRHNERESLDAVCVDYLQLCRAPRADRYQNREREVAEMSQSLKQLAKELQCPVIVLAQLNREAEKAKRAPQLSDLRESGSVEQDADAVLFIHREWVVMDQKQREESPHMEREATVIIGKDRAGRVGMVTLGWDGPTTTFRDLDRNQAEPARAPQTSWYDQ